MDHEADPFANAHVGNVTIGGGLSYIVSTNPQSALQKEGRARILRPRVVTGRRAW
jgi:hypothetical protein